MQLGNKVMAFDAGGESLGTIPYSYDFYTTTRDGVSGYFGALANTVAVVDRDEVVIAAHQPVPGGPDYRWGAAIYRQTLSGNFTWTSHIQPSATTGYHALIVLGVKIVGSEVIAWGYDRRAGAEANTSVLWMARRNLTTPNTGAWYQEFGAISGPMAVAVEPVFLEATSDVIAVRGKYKVSANEYAYTPVYSRSFATGAALASFTPTQTDPMRMHATGLLNARGERWHAATGTFRGWNPVTGGNAPPPNRPDRGLFWVNRADDLASVSYTFGELRTGAYTEEGTPFGSNYIEMPGLTIKDASVLDDGSLLVTGLDADGDIYATRTDPWMYSVCNELCWAKRDTACVGNGACGVELCNSTGGCNNSIAACDDGIACTNDTCDTTTERCSHAMNSCEDGDLCTTNSCLVNSSCSGATAQTCDDKNACTNDSCNPAGGCVFTAGLNGASCSESGFISSGICGGTWPASLTCKPTSVGPTLCYQIFTSTGPLQLSHSLAASAGPSNIVVPAVKNETFTIEWIRIRTKSIRTGTLASVRLRLNAPLGETAIIRDSWTVGLSESTDTFPGTIADATTWAIPTSYLGKQSGGTWGLTLERIGNATNTVTSLNSWELWLGYQCPTP
jgi:hypothetical protein